MAVADTVLDMGRRVNIDMETGTVIGTRKLRDSGNSTVLTIPPEVLDVANLEDGDEVTITADMDTGEIKIAKKEEEDSDEGDEEPSN